jgi:hypothetical protein
MMHVLVLVEDMHKILMLDLSTNIIAWKALHLLDCLLSSLVHWCLHLSEELIVGLVSGSKPLLLQYLYCITHNTRNIDDTHQLPLVLDIELELTTPRNKQGKTHNTITEVLNHNSISFLLFIFLAAAVANPMTVAESGV